MKRRTKSHAEIERSRSLGPKGIRFIDKDEHMYFWFPLLAGLSELTFDPRQEIRCSSLEVLFDTLKFHGKTFAESFWARVLDSVLLPIFDHVRAEVCLLGLSDSICWSISGEYDVCWVFKDMTWSSPIVTSVMYINLEKRILMRLLFCTL